MFYENGSKMEKGLTINKIRMMTNDELIDLRRNYNIHEHEFIIYVIDNELENRI